MFRDIGFPVLFCERAMNRIAFADCSKKAGGLDRRLFGTSMQQRSMV